VNREEVLREFGKFVGPEALCQSLTEFCLRFALALLEGMRTGGKDDREISNLISRFIDLKVTLEVFTLVVGEGFEEGIAAVESKVLREMQEIVNSGKGGVDFGGEEAEIVGKVGFDS